MSSVIPSGFVDHDGGGDEPTVLDHPDGGEVAPAKLSHDVISIVEEIANFHRMVST